MTDSNDLVGALTAIGDLTRTLGADDLDRPTPCEGWVVAEVLGHLVVDLDNLDAMSGGADPDFGRGPEAVTDPSPVADRIEAATARFTDTAPGAPAGMFAAEFLVHGWDLARATGTDLHVDDALAERARGFMTENLTPDRRGDAFGPEVDVPQDAGALDRLVGFAGRDPGWTRS